MVGREIRIIDYYEASGVDLGHYVREIDLRPYVYAGHIVPHDAQAKELGTGKSRLEVLESLGLKNITARADAPDRGRHQRRARVGPEMLVRRHKCARGIDALKLYRATVDDKMHDPAGRPVLGPQPVHDWTSHAADSFRYLAMTLDRRISMRASID